MDENIVEEFFALAKAKRWQEALPLIEVITALAPLTPESWHNFGICLTGLGRHSEAADMFLQAYELDPEDHRLQYRAFRSLFEAGEEARFVALARREIQRMPEVLGLLLEDPDFGVLCRRPAFEKLRQEIRVARRRARQISDEGEG